MARLLRASAIDARLASSHIATPLQLPSPLPNLLYASLTTLARRQTLGEEATGLIPVHVTQHGAPSLPSTKRLAALVLLGTFGRRVLLKFLRVQVVDLLERLHRAVFLVWPEYLEVSRRIAGVSHVTRGDGGLGEIGRMVGVLAVASWVGDVVRGGWRHKESLHPDAAVEHRGEGTGCPLCVTPTSPLAAATPCGHVACWDCLQRWLGEEGTCPVCREPSPALLPLLNLTNTS